MSEATDPFRDLPPGVRVLTGNDLANISDTPPAVLYDGLVIVRRGQRIAIHAAPNAKKTMLALWVAAHVLAGGGRCAILAGESSERPLKRRIDSMLRHWGLDLAKVGDRLRIATGAFDITGEKGQRLYGDLVMLHPDLIVVDPLVSFVHGDENAAADMARVLGVVERIAQQDGAVILVHHSAKPSQGRPSDMRGSGVVRGWADEVYELSEAPKLPGIVRIANTKSRDSDRRPPTTFRGVFPDGGPWYLEGADVEGDVHRGTRATPQQRDPLSALLAALGREEKTQTELAEALRWSSSVTRKTIRDGVELGRIAVVPRAGSPKQRGDRYRAVHADPSPTPRRDSAAGQGGGGPTELRTTDAPLKGAHPLSGTVARREEDGT